jgi:hypothetical protein
MIEKGFVSDPPGISFYVKKLNYDGTPKVDQKGLQLYRCLRGTGKVESLHEMYTRCLGHTRAGAQYTDCLLVEIRKVYNWRMSFLYRPNFPRLRHYNGQAIDLVNDLYESCFNAPKYPSWVSANDVVIPPGVSPYGIVPNEGFKSIDRKVTSSQDYIAARQGSDVAYLPVYGEEEYKLFNILMMKAVKNNSSLNSSNTFTEIAKEWNLVALGKNQIFKKNSILLARYFKRWSANRQKKEAASNLDVDALIRALSYTPQVRTGDQASDDIIVPLAVGQGIKRPIPHESHPSESSAVQENKPAEVAEKPARKRKICRECLDIGCSGGYKREKCPIYRQNHSEEMSNDRVSKAKRKCSHCKLTACPGRGGLKYCSMIENTNDGQLEQI